MLAAMRQLLEEKRRLEKETTTDDAWATRPGPGASDLAPGLEAAVAAAEKFAAEARTPLLRARRKCWYDAEIQKPVILRDLLSSDDVAKLRRMRAALEPPGARGTCSAILQKNRTTPSVTCTTTASRSGPNRS